MSEMYPDASLRTTKAIRYETDGVTTCTVLKERNRRIVVWRMNDGVLVHFIRADRTESAPPTLENHSALDIWRTTRMGITVQGIAVNMSYWAWESFRVAHDVLNFNNKHNFTRP